MGWKNLVMGLNLVFELKSSSDMLQSIYSFRGIFENYGNTPEQFTANCTASRTIIKKQLMLKSLDKLI